MHLSAYRTAISGFVFLARIEAITSDRFARVNTSATLAIFRQLNSGEGASFRP
jgi:hypothetical protein